MSDRNILIVKNSWSYIITQPDRAGEMFYAKLVELDPTLKTVFQSDLEQQSERLMDMITFMVSNLRNRPDIQQEVGALALRHAKYGTKPEHFRTIGEALIWLLENSLGALWSDETHHAWRSQYRLWVDVMCNASEGKLAVNCNEWTGTLSHANPTTI